MRQHDKHFGQQKTGQNLKTPKPQPAAKKPPAKRVIALMHGTQYVAIKPDNQQKYNCPKYRANNMAQMATAPPTKKRRAKPAALTEKTGKNKTPITSAAQKNPPIPGR